MAIDYLSTPASSVDIECALSHGTFMVTHCHHALSDQSTHNSIVIGAWLKDTKLILKEELIEFFQKKTARERLEAIDSTPADKAVNESESSRVICENHLCKSSPSLIFLFSHGSESNSRNQ